MQLLRATSTRTLAAEITATALKTTPCHLTAETVTGNATDTLETRENFARELRTRRLTPPIQVRLSSRVKARVAVGESDFEHETNVCLPCRRSEKGSPRTWERL